MMSMVLRTVVSSIVDSKKLQTLKISIFKDDTKDDVERFQNFGHTSVPKDGAEAVVVFPSGNIDHPIVVVVDDRRYRLKGLNPGESAIYDAFGKKAHLKDDGSFEILLQKLKVQNETYELLSLLVDLFDELIAAKAITGIGPQPFTPATIVKFQLLKAKFETFKV